MCKYQNLVKSQATFGETKPNMFLKDDVMSVRYLRVARQQCTMQCSCVFAGRDPVTLNNISSNNDAEMSRLTTPRPWINSGIPRRSQSDWW